MKYTDAEIQKCIKSGLKAYKENAKCFYRKYPNAWKKKSLAEKVAMARSWVYMSHVANEPKLYFAPEYTLAQWRARAHSYTMENKLGDMHIAYLIVPGPKEIVETGSKDAIHEPYVSAMFFQKYHGFLKLIQDYEYADKGWGKEIDAKMIQEESRRINDVLEVNKTKCLFRPFKRIQILFRNLQNVK